SGFAPSAACGGKEGLPARHCRAGHPNAKRAAPGRTGRGGGRRWRDPSARSAPPSTTNPQRPTTNTPIRALAHPDLPSQGKEPPPRNSPPRPRARMSRLSPPRADMTATQPQPLQANAQRQYEVHRADLPLSCPLPSMALWNSHPRVYLPIETEGGEADCPYCSAHFVLVD